MTLAGEAKNDHASKHGIYILADGVVNGYPYWVREDEKYALWFTKSTASWIVGAKDKLGTNTGYIVGPYGRDNYPNDIKQGWTYSHGGKFKEAPSSDIIFKVKG